MKYNARAKEEQLDSKTAFGISDPTPKEAISNIIVKKRWIENEKQNSSL
jgi:hypothetical protein